MAEIKKDNYKRINLKRQKLENVEDHDYMILTDNEDFIHENIEIVEGYHHLTNRSNIFNNNQLDLNGTSEEQKIQEQNFEQFEVDCCKAFQFLRERAYVYINLLQLMLVSEIEELKQEDIKFLIDAMLLNMSEEQAQSEFKKLIHKALNTGYRKFDNLFHNINDKKKGEK